MFLAPKGRDMVVDFFKEFPEIISYLKKNVDKWNNRFQLPRVHEVS